MPLVQFCMAPARSYRFFAIHAVFLIMAPNSHVHFIKTKKTSLLYDYHVYHSTHLLKNANFSHNLAEHMFFVKLLLPSSLVIGIIAATRFSRAHKFTSPEEGKLCAVILYILTRCLKIQLES